MDLQQNKNIAESISLQLESDDPNDCAHKSIGRILNEKRQRYLIFHNQYFNFTK